MAIREDYIMRQIILMAEFIRKALSVRHVKNDPLFFENTYAAIELATNMEAATLLRMDPQSLVMMLELAQVSDRTGKWITAAIELEAERYLEEGDEQMAGLRQRQADAVRRAFLVDEPLQEILDEADALSAKGNGASEENAV